MSVYLTCFGRHTVWRDRVSGPRRVSNTLSWCALTSGTFLNCHERTTFLSSHCYKEAGNTHWANLVPAQSLRPSSSKSSKVPADLRAGKNRKGCCCLSLRFMEYVLWSRRADSFCRRAFSQANLSKMNRKSPEAVFQGYSRTGDSGLFPFPLRHPSPSYYYLLLGRV